MRPTLALFALLPLLSACVEEGPKPAPESRFDGVKAARQAAAAVGASGFCDKSFPASGEGSVRYTPPRTRSIPGGGGSAGAASGGWTWVNVWATWCEPCREEMGLLGKWKDGLAREGSPISLALVSVDEPEAAAALQKAIAGKLPGPVSWTEDSGAFLEALQVGRDSSIPIHAFVDPKGQLRCVRVGAIHDRDWGSVKAILAGS